MQKLVLDQGIKQIAIEDTNGDLLTVLKINIADARTAERFANLIKRLNALADEMEAREKELAEKYKDRPLTEDDVDIEQVLERSQTDIEYLEKCIAELDSVFGEGTVRNVYKHGYELNADFVPDETALAELVEKLTPVMSELFNQRFENIRKKYNSSKRGKHTKTKDELIQEYRRNHE